MRLAPGFSTRPDSRAMAAHFRAQGDEATAALFRPSSMEAIRALGGDALTLVSEMPLFVPAIRTPSLSSTLPSVVIRASRAPAATPQVTFHCEPSQTTLVP